MGTYPIDLEVSGPLAMFARPDTGGSPTSYPAPTWSAAKGLLKSMAFFVDGKAWLHPTQVEDFCSESWFAGRVRSPINATPRTMGGQLRKDLNIKNGTGMQIFATVLANVCYRIRAEVRGVHGEARSNPRHHLQELFERRLQAGSLPQDAGARLVGIHV